MTDTKSVKRYDALPTGGLIPLYLADATPITPSLLPDMSGQFLGNTNGLDRVLRSTVKVEGMWANAVNVAVASVLTLDWRVESNIPLRAKVGKELLDYYPYLDTMEKTLSDYLLTNNGGIAEIVRASSARGSKILGITHLDSIYCQRTGDNEIPFIYQSRTGSWHELKYWQVLDFVDQPSASRDEFGRGLCAAYRAYSAIRKMATLEQYILEKVGGKRPLAIYLVSGVQGKALESGIKTMTNPFEPNQSQAQPLATDAQSFMGALVIPVYTMNGVQVVKIPLAELPDGFNRKEEFDITLLHYAKALGLDPQDLQPLASSSSLGSTATQSEVLDRKAESYGIGAFKQKWVQAMKQVLPTSTTFAFSDNDAQNRILQAQASKARTDDLTVLVEKQIITADHARQIKVDAGDLPDFVLTQPDATPDLDAANTDPNEEGSRDATTE